MSSSSPEESQSQDSREALASDQRYSALVVHLSSEYGPLIGGAALVKALGFRSSEALRQAVSRKKLPVKTFPIKNRRGRFAYTVDVARWLAAQASNSEGGAT